MKIKRVSGPLFAMALVVSSAGCSNSNETVHQASPLSTPTMTPAMSSTDELFNALMADCGMSESGFTNATRAVNDPTAAEQTFSPTRTMACVQDTLIAAGADDFDFPSARQVFRSEVPDGWDAMTPSEESFIASHDAMVDGEPVNVQVAYRIGSRELDILLASNVTVWVE
ncbi:hypothetical protein [Demequina sp. NBRC 110051]|uniref:hypothetical protein n=1 Tax=Demequina sp. NBRC 110051 TaxID=1570340 RepID=UPI00117BEA1B|nr:hypothetical protein [Demequina sp. NBRC 110051]